MIAEVGRRRREFDMLMLYPYERFESCHLTIVCYKKVQPAYKAPEYAYARPGLRVWP